MIRYSDRESSATHGFAGTVSTHMDNESIDGPRLVSHEGSEQDTFSLAGINVLSSI